MPALVLASLLTPAVAAADYNELLKDACRDERVDGTYPQKDYREALANIPADADQYTNCRGVLRAAQLAAARAQAAGRSGAAPVSAEHDRRPQRRPTRSRRPRPRRSRPSPPR